MTSPLSITLTPYENILNGITLYERIDPVALNKLINSDLLLTTEWKEGYFQNEKQQLQQYYNKCKNGIVQVSYNIIAGNPFGRSNPEKSLSLFTIRREIRHTISKAFYVDVDIENCHPEILYQICVANDIPCRLLGEYVKNRQHYLDIVMTEYSCTYKQAKVLFIIILYGGGFKGWAETNNIDKPPLPIIQEFKDEFAQIANTIMIKNPEIAEAVIKRKQEQGQTDFNLAGSVCSHFLQEYEIRILEMLFKYCVENKFIQRNCAVLCADGLMIEKEFYDPSLLSIFSQIIQNEFGFNLQFTTKDMNEDYLKILDNHIVMDLHHPTFSTGLLSDYFSILYGDKFLFNDKKLYVYNGVYWEIDNTSNATLSRFIDKQFYAKLVGYACEKQKHYTQLYSATDNAENEKKLKLELDKLATFQKDIQSLRQVKYRDNLIKDVLNKISDDTVEFDTHPLLFTFNNKVFDLRRDMFIDSHYTQYISMTAGYDYNDKYDQKLTNELDALFDTIFPMPEVKSHYLERLSTGLCGLHIQSFNIAQGAGGNGKSVINSLQMKMLGHYGYKLPSSVILQEIKEGGNPQVANMHKMRFVLMQEPNGKRKICCATMKEITGDKCINVRLLHSNKCGIVLQLTLMMECNDLPLLDEVEEAEVRRIDVTPFVSKFVSQERYETIEDKTNVFIGNSYYTSDEFQDTYKQALFEILRKSFKSYVENRFQFSPTPEVCKSKTKDYLAVSDDIYDWVRNTYTYVKPSDEGYISPEPLYLSDMYIQFKVGECFRSLSKAQQRKYSKTYFEDKVRTNLFLINDFVDRDGYINGVQLKKPALKNWKYLN